MADQTATRRPHYMEAEIRALLTECPTLTNAEVARRLYVGKQAVGRIRATADIPPVPRSAYAYQPHPKERTIWALLHEGYTDAEIGRRTGADVRVIADRRTRGKVGPDVVRVRAPYVHPRDAEIRTLLATHTDTAISTKLGVDRAAVRRARRLAGTEAPAGSSPASPEEKWSGLLRPVPGGHVEWLGSRSTASGTPVMRWRGKSVAPAALAFRARTGRDPVGPVIAECDYRHCLAPDHVDDQDGRNRLRAQLRAITGSRPLPTMCAYGHDQTVHRLFQPDGTTYCAVCKREQRAACRARHGGGPPRPTTRSTHP